MQMVTQILRNILDRAALHYETILPCYVTVKELSMQQRILRRS